MKIIREEQIEIGTPFITVYLPDEVSVIGIQQKGDLVFLCYTTESSDYSSSCVELRTVAEGDLLDFKGKYLGSYVEETIIYHVYWVTKK